MEDISSGAELLLHMFPVSKVGRAAQLLLLEFSKDGLANLGGQIYIWWFGQSASYTVRTRTFLRLYVTVIARFNPSCNGHCKLATLYLMQRCMHSLMRLKTAGAS